MSTPKIATDQLLTELSPDFDATIIARAIRKSRTAKKKSTPTTVELVGMVGNIHITDTIEGSSTLEVEMFDSEYDLLDGGFFDADKNGRLDVVDLNFPDGSKMWWRLSQLHVQNNTITLTFMERPAMLLMSHNAQNSKGTPIKGSRAGQTRAQFIKRLVQSVKAYGGIEFVSKDLNVQQVIGDEGAETSAVTGDILNAGDSLAVGMDTLGGLPSRYKTVATGGHSTAQILAAVSALPASQRRYVVIGAGTNDGTLGAFTSNFDSILGLSGIERIWAFNVKGNPAGLDSGINAALESRASSNSKLRIIDWAAEVNSGRVTLTDGVHPNTAGYQRRVAMAETAVGHVSRPKDDKEQRDAAKEVQESAKDAGLSTTQRSDLKVAGKVMNEAQRWAVDVALRVAAELDAGAKATKAIIVAGIGESNFNYNSLNSLGYGNVWQGQVETGGRYWKLGRDDVEEMARSFMLGGKGFREGAIKVAKENPTWTAGTVAEYVEVSGVGGGFYDKFGDEADAIIEAGGGASSGSTTSTYRRQYNFQVGSQENPRENFWDAMLRLGHDEVNWALFLDRNRVFFDPEMTLIRQKIADSWHREDPETLDFDYTWDLRQIATEMSVTRICDPFEFRAGEVIKLNGFGPASTGSMARPDPLPGRWLIAQIERDRYDFHSVFTLKQPEPTHVEPITELVTKTEDEASDASMADISGDMTPKDVIDQIVIPMGAALDLTDANGNPVTALGVERANGAHSETTTTGNKSQHKGPPSQAWAADISEGGAQSPTEKTKKFARQLKERFNISGDFPWGPTLGNGRAEDEHFRYQLIHGVTGTANGGNHMNHVHFGVGKK